MTDVQSLPGHPPYYPWLIFSSCYAKENECGKKATTISPNGRHLGHYKNLFTVIDESFESDERKELKEIQEKIA